MLRGWVDLTSDKPHTLKKSIKYLEQGMQDSKDVLGLMGKVGSGGRERISAWAPGAREPLSPGLYLAHEEQGPREDQGHTTAQSPLGSHNPACSVWVPVSFCMESALGPSFFLCFFLSRFLF